MGNRGCLHRDGNIVRHHNGKLWIICDPTASFRTAPQWTEGRYTVLFFHDEAVALAAGHRPCARCREAHYARFNGAWATAFGTTPSAEEIDRQLHAERYDRRAPHQRTHTAEWATLPDGTFALLDDEPILIQGTQVIPWRHDGYRQPRPLPTSGKATVLTPPSTVAVLHAGYQPDIHLTPAPRRERRRDSPAR